jgi:hypothetical protein
VSDEEVGSAPRDAPNHEALGRALSGDKWARYGRFILAALGSLPWVGGLLGAAASMQAETGQQKTNLLLRDWVAEHQEKTRRLAETMAKILDRLDELGEEPKRRVEDPSYLDVVRKAFRVWDKCDTDRKRDLVRRLLTNAAAVNLCSDDLVRLFLDWIERWHEIHFAIIGAVHGREGITLAGIWEAIGGAEVREDSAEADLFGLLIRDLTIGGVIRQHRETTEGGEFMRRRQRRPQGSTMKSKFNDVDGYELTNLGRQFVHYAMNEAVPRIQAQGRQ